MVDICFQILVVENGTQVDSGTGFIINRDGYFVSAGHVFKNQNCSYFALVDNKQHPIKTAYSEYIDPKCQSEPDYKDLFIGKIECSFSERGIVQFSDKVESDENYIVCGFSNKIVKQPKYSSLDAYFSDDSGGNFEVDEQPKYFEFNFVCTNLHIFRARDNKIKYFKNGFELDIKGRKLFGLSGGPIIRGTEIYGMLIAKNTCISSKYILAKLKELDISTFN